jgi:hypothetical protein
MAKEGEKRTIDQDVDVLYQLPGAEFTRVRNALAAALRRTGREHEAARVSSLAKPSASAWVANPLYWKHRDSFTKLMSAGRQLVQAQLAQPSVKGAGLRSAQAELRKAVSTLLGLAAELLRDSGHKETPEMTRSIDATIEALSLYPPGSAAPVPGRRTTDVNPPGFELITALVLNLGTAQPSAKPKQKVIPFKSADTKEIRETAASARAGLQDAEKRLEQARMKFEELTDTRDKASIAADECGKRRREAEERLHEAQQAE